MNQNGLLERGERISGLDASLTLVQKIRSKVEMERLHSIKDPFEARLEFIE